MSKKVYLAFYDEADGNHRESWSVFYCPVVVAETEKKALALADDKLSELVEDEDERDLYHIHVREVTLGEES